MTSDVLVVSSHDAGKIVRSFASTFAIQCGLIAVFCLVAYEALGLRRSRTLALVLVLAFAAAGGYFDFEFQCPTADPEGTVRFE